MNSVKHSAGFVIGRPVDQVFPLFTPEGEKLWAPGWNYEDIMGTAEIFEDYIFLTKQHDHASIEAIWLVKRYEPENHLVQYYKVEPGDKVGIVTVQCSSQVVDTTHVQVSYEYIALSEKGRTFTKSFTKEAYDTFIAHWEDQILKYFEKTLTA